jgi:DNA mismatch endonuclease, patch repair protein
LRSKNTKPELLVQEALVRRNIRFRTHDRSLPGTPDIVLIDYPIAVLVHGCYWHKHHSCQSGMRSNESSPLAHLARNAAAARDVRILNNLKARDLNVFVAWECHLKFSIDEVITRLETLIKVL